jgi:serine/threonine protein kinase
MEEYKYNKYVHKINKLNGGWCETLNNDEHNIDIVKNAKLFEFTFARGSAPNENGRYTSIFTRKNKDNTQYYKIVLTPNPNPIGKGSFGTVYPVDIYIMNNVTGVTQKQNIVMKVVDKKKINSINFCNETISLSLLDHPNIAKYYGYYESNNNYYLFFERIIGEELKIMIRNNLLSIDDKIRITIDLMRGFYHMHDKNIYHRDIKPENIMIEKTNGVYMAKYIDFGFSCAHDVLCNKQKLAGTPNYISPQMITNYNTREIKHHDVWALATTIMYIFTQKYMIPSEARNFEQNLKNYGKNYDIIKERINTNFIFSELKIEYPTYNELIDIIIQFIEMMTYVPAINRKIPTIDSINMLIEKFNLIKDEQGVPYDKIPLFAPIRHHHEPRHEMHKNESHYDPYHEQHMTNTTTNTISNYIARSKHMVKTPPTRIPNTHYDSLQQNQS